MYVLILLFSCFTDAKYRSLHIEVSVWKPSPSTCFHWPQLTHLWLVLLTLVALTTFLYSSFPIESHYLFLTPFNLLSSLCPLDPYWALFRFVTAERLPQHFVCVQSRISSFRTHTYQHWWFQCTGILQILTATNRQKTSKLNQFAPFYFETF